MTYYLYVKTHSTTGLKYLGQTRSKDPHKYHGSGKYWLAHLKKHGKNFTTEIIKECKSIDQLSHWGHFYSNLWNIVNSDEWANLKPESGEGGWYLVGDLNPQKRPEVRQKTSEGMKKYLASNPKTLEQKKKHSDWNKKFWTEDRKRDHPISHSLSTVSVTDLNGISMRISKEQCDLVDRNLPLNQQQYVSVSSKEAKRRRITLGP
jgi:hypothetical protein